MDKPRMEDLVAEDCDHFVSYLREGVGYMNNAEEGDREREREREGSHQHSGVPFFQWLCGQLLCIHLSTLPSTLSGGKHIHGLILVTGLLGSLIKQLYLGCEPPVYLRDIDIGEVPQVLCTMLQIVPLVLKVQLFCQCTFQLLYNTIFGNHTALISTYPHTLHTYIQHPG